ncbi:MAG: Spy/CpxP family protein refolding chaperone [Rhodospirillales bacterium]|nr:Spy/CpxP family protein refolding chaperone [Rhodospirillales bacterium]
MKKPAIAALLMSIAALPAAAQPASPVAASGERGRAHFERMCGDADARIASRLAYIEAKVHPTPAQRAAWEAFARESRAAGEPMKRLCENPPARAARDDAAANLAARERFATAMAASLTALRPAVERFQAVLDDGQKAELARALSPRGRSRHHR